MINLITSFYILKEIDKISIDRNNELLNSLMNNINSKYISKIHLYLDDEISLRKIESINNNKINIISTSKQPLYSDLFEYAINNLKNEICMVSNSDIYLHECDIDCINRISDNIFTLTRYEHDFSCKLINNYVGSHDAFIFKSPLNKNILTKINHYQNIWGSENEVIDTLVTYGYKLYNPCYQIKIVHLHSSNLRNPDRIRMKYGKFLFPPSYY